MGPLMIHFATALKSRGTRHLGALAAALAGLLIVPGLLLAQDKKGDTTEKRPLVWEQQLYGTWNGKTVLLHNDSITYAKLAFGDLDGDGDEDLLVGKGDGSIDRFENVAGKRKPDWRLIKERMTALSPNKSRNPPFLPLPINVGEHAAPSLVDIDLDGDLDLFVGAKSGRIIFYRNIGNIRLAHFRLETDRFLPRVYGKNITPYFSDVDGNRSPDLLLGNHRGEVYLILNNGTPRRPAFCVERPGRNALPDEEPPCRPVPRLLSTVKPESFAVPALVDWDKDNDLDLFVGVSKGTLHYYQNVGSPFKPEWQLSERPFQAIDAGGFLAPAFLDVNDDSRPDMLLGSTSASVYLYTNKGVRQYNDVWQVTPNILNIRRFSPGINRSAVTSGDLDADKDMDLVVGDAHGRLILLENTGDPNNPSWQPFKDIRINPEKRKNTAPLLHDLDGDGDLDLLVGGHDGRIWQYENQGSAKSPRFKLVNDYLAGIDTGNDSILLMADLDGDKDSELLVGNARGYVILFMNEGSAKKPDFRLASTKFGGASVRRNAAPALFDLDSDGRKDLIIGSVEGSLLTRLNRNPPEDTGLKKWDKPEKGLEELFAKRYSVPHFVDINGDGTQDLLLGDGHGNVRLWLNRGQAPPKEAPKPTSQTVADNGEAAIDGGSAPGFPQGGQPAITGSVFGQDEEAPLPGQTGSGLLPAPGVIEEVPEGPLPPLYVLASQSFGDIKYNGRVAPSFADLDNDKDLDMVLGVADGKVAYYENIGNRQEPKWKKAADNLLEKIAGRYPSPLLVDMDGDKTMDLVLGLENGRVKFYKNQSRRSPKFTLVADALKGVAVGRNAAPAVALLNNDPHMDLLVGNLSGKLLSFIRVGKGNSLNFKKQDRRYLGVDIGVSSTPFVGDIDRDRNPDILVGSDQGRVVTFVKVPKSKKQPWGWQSAEQATNKVKYPSGSTPRLADIDHDGDMDLFLGSEKGSIYFYRNDASQ